jgi:predicted metalloendopeptidase
MHPRDAYLNFKKALAELKESGVTLHDVAYYESTDDIVLKLLKKYPQPVVRVIQMPDISNIVVSWEDK